MGRCACSMPPVLLTVVPVPYVRSVKNMVRPPKNLVVSALCCIHCLRQCQKSSHLPAFLPLIPSCGVIGRAVSLAEPGYEGLEATWSPWKPRPFHHPPRRLLLSRALSERIGVCVGHNGSHGMPDYPPPRLSRLPSMGSHPCLPRPSVCGSLEPTALSMKLVLNVGSLVERVSLRVFVTVSHSLMLFVGHDRWFF